MVGYEESYLFVCKRSDFIESNETVQYSTDVSRGCWSDDKQRGEVILGS